MEPPASAIGASGKPAGCSARVFGVLVKRIAGGLLIVLGVVALTAPLATGRWSLAFLGICVIVLGLVEAYAAFTSPKRTQVSAYLPSVLGVLAGNVLLLSASLVLDGLLILLIVILVPTLRCRQGSNRPTQRTGATLAITCQRSPRLRRGSAALVSQSKDRDRAGHWHYHRWSHRGCRMAAV